MESLELSPSCPSHHPKHHLFLSHSGHQKGFAIDLYERLSSLSYDVFFDKDDVHHSVPPGQPFPPLIFSAANTCELAIVVLSDEFLSSKWPVIELCVFAERLTSQSDSLAFTLLPLFFKLSPGDVKNEENLERWRKAWNGFEQKDDRFSASNCERAVTKVLPPRNGIVRRSESEQGEASYLNEVVDAIIAIKPAPRPFTILHKKYSGRNRLCKVILDKFRELEDTRSSSADACILGMYGVRGTGKSTLCGFLCEATFNELNGNVIYLELPTDSDSRADKMSLMSEECSKILSKFSPYLKDIASMDLKTVLHRLNHAMSIKKVLLVLDNITASNYESYKLILPTLFRLAVVGPGSRIVLVAQSAAFLDGVCKLFEKEICSSKYRYATMEVPSMTKEEAREVLRDRCPSMKEELATRLLNEISFPTSSSMYIPFVFEQIGVRFGEFHCSDLEEVDLESFLTMVNEEKKNAVQKLVEMNFKLLKEDLKVLFLDIALFIIPARYSRLGDATRILTRMHGISNTFQLKWKRIAENSASHVFQPSLDISDSLVNIDPARKQYWQNPLRTTDPQRVHLKCLEARSIYIGICAAPSVSCDDRQVHIHVEVGATAQALIVTNRNVSSKCILVLSGDLSSLVCIATENMEQGAFFPCGNDGNLSSLVRLESRNQFVSHHQDSRMKTYGGQKTKLAGSCSSLKPFLFRWEQQLVSNFITSGRMRGLHILILHKFSGMFRTSVCPLLEILEITNKRKEQMDVRIDKAPKLKRFWARSTYHQLSFRGRIKQWKNSKLALQLTECPELEEIRVDESFEIVKVEGLLPSKLQHFAVADFGCPLFFPSNLISSSAHQLTELRCIRLEWAKVGKLHFTREHVGCLPKLETLLLQECTGLTHVSVNRGCAPNLVCLQVSYCYELQVLEGDTTLMEKLETLFLANLRQLRWECDVMLSSLKSLTVMNCPQVTIDVDVLRASKNLEDVILEGRGDTAVVEKKQQQAMENNGGGGESQVWVALNRWIFSDCQFMFLRVLSITGLRDLREIEGIQHLRSVAYLWLCEMPNLVRVSGAWPSSILRIKIRDCPMLQEVPPIEGTPCLRYLQFYRCVRLKAVEVGHSHVLDFVVFLECKSMESFPMEGQPLFMDEWGKNKGSEYRHLSVKGSKFASEEAMEKWLREAEEGSPLYRAAQQRRLRRGYTRCEREGIGFGWRALIYWKNGN